MPGGNRVRTATSSDGITWSRIPAAILDQIDTPSLVIGPKGLPLLYTTAHQVNGRQDGFVVSIGTADGKSWRHCQVSLKGFPAGLLGVDPDVVSLSGGSYRMYLTGSASSDSSRIAIHYSDSADGLTWTYGGLAFEHSEYFRSTLLSDLIKKSLKNSNFYRASSRSESRFWLWGVLQKE